MTATSTITKIVTALAVSLFVTCLMTAWPSSALAGAKKSKETSGDQPVKYMQFKMKRFL